MEDYIDQKLNATKQTTWVGINQAIKIIQKSFLENIRVALTLELKILDRILFIYSDSQEVVNKATEVRSNYITLLENARHELKAL